MSNKKEKKVLNALFRENFYAFVRKAFNETHGSEHFHDSFAIELICDRLEKCMRGEIRKLIINIPPRNLKSFITSICLPAYILGKDPKKQIISVSYSADLANKLSRDSRALMEMPFYKEIFKTRLGDKNTENIFETTKQGSRTATTVQGSLTGLGGDFLILDDPCSADDVLSPVKRKKLNDWFRNTFLSRLNDKKNGVMIVIMQRLHEDDLTALLKEQGGWEILSLPAIAEDNENFLLSDGRNVGRKKGGVLNPDHEPLEILLELQNSMSEYNFAAQYQQNPIPEKGNIIDFDDFRKFDYAQLPANAEIIQSWDIALKDGINNDCSVCITGLFADNNLYILDILRNKWDINNLENMINFKAEQFKASRVIIEESPISECLIQRLERESSIRIERYNPKGTSKIVRAQNANYYILKKSVWIPNDACWIKDFRTEILTFPNGKNDDQVDALSQMVISCFSNLSFNVRKFSEGMGKLKFQMWARERYGITPDPPDNYNWHL